MTPAITLLQKKRIAHDVLKYQHASHAPSYGLEAAEKLNLKANTVFKTLVVATDSGQLAVAVVPVDTMLSEKKMAKILGVKKVAMAKADHVVSSTGYILGGVSPLGQKKSLPTVVHESAQQLKRIYVSAGRRGLEVALSPGDLTALTRGRFADITG